MFRRSAPKKPQIIQVEPREKTEISVFLHKQEPVITSADKVLINSNSTPKLSVSTNPDRIQTSVCICMLIDKEFTKYLTRVKENLSFLQSTFNNTFTVFVAHNVQNDVLDDLNILDNTLVINSESVHEYEQRNLYLKFVQENRLMFNYMMVVDPKISLGLPLKKESFNFFSDVDFNVAFANQTYKYYDIESLIEGSKQVYTIEDENMKNAKIKQYQKHIPKHTELIPVQSAFGGFAVYNTNVLDSSNKYTTDNHISFNLSISKQYSKMFIVPSFLIETLPSNAFLYVR
jgi:hypothetical protein